MRRWLGVLGVVVVAAIVWWLTGRSHETRSRDATAHDVTASSAAPVPRSPAPPASRVRRLSPEQRQALRAQIERARVAQAAPRPPALPEAAADGDNAMGTVEQVLQQVMAVMPELRREVAGCQRFAPDATGFTTKIALVGDVDLGTLIDAASALVPADGPPFPPAFDDCVRDVLQTLALPPMHTGDQFTVSFQVSFTDE